MRSAGLDALMHGFVQLAAELLKSRASFQVQRWHELDSRTRRGEWRDVPGELHKHLLNAERARDALQLFSEEPHRVELRLPRR